MKDWQACLIGVVIAIVIILGCGYYFDKVAWAQSHRGEKEPRIQVDTGRGHILVYTFYDVEMGVLCYVHHEGIACVEKREAVENNILKEVNQGRAEGKKIMYFDAPVEPIDKPSEFPVRDLYK